MNKTTVTIEDFEKRKLKQKMKLISHNVFYFLLEKAAFNF